MYPLLPSALWDFDEGHCTGWEIGDVCRCLGKCLLGQGQLHCSLTCTFVAQLMGTGAENPACFQLENAWGPVPFINLKCLPCILSTMKRRVCWNSNTFRPHWVKCLRLLYQLSTYTIILTHPGEMDSLAIDWMTKVSRFPSGIRRQEIHEPQLAPHSGCITEQLSHGLISVWFLPPEH